LNVERNNSDFEKELRDYLFSKKDIAVDEADITHGA